MVGAGAMMVLLPAAAAMVRDRAVVMVLLGAMVQTASFPSSGVSSMAAAAAARVPPAATMPPPPSPAPPYDAAEGRQLPPIPGVIDRVTTLVLLSYVGFAGTFILLFLIRAVVGSFLVVHGGNLGRRVAGQDLAGDLDLNLVLQVFSAITRLQG